MPKHPRELGHHVPSSQAVQLPSLAQPSVTHGTSLSLISLPSTGGSLLQAQAHGFPLAVFSVLAFAFLSYQKRKFSLGVSTSLMLCTCFLAGGGHGDGSS